MSWYHEIIRSALKEHFPEVNDEDVDDDILDYIFSVLSFTKADGTYSVANDDDTIDTVQAFIGQFAAESNQPDNVHAFLDTITNHLTQQQLHQEARNSSSNSTKETEPSSEEIHTGNGRGNTGATRKKTGRKQDITSWLWTESQSESGAEPAASSGGNGTAATSTQTARSDGTSCVNPIRPVCRHMLEGGCFRADCEFSHDVSHMPCRFWLQGHCEKGDQCPFMHPTEPQQHVSSLIPCKFFFDRGFCRNGDACPFSHGGPPCQEIDDVTETVSLEDNTTNTQQVHRRIDPSEPFSFGDKIKLKKLQEMFPGLDENTIELCFLENGRFLSETQDSLAKQTDTIPEHVSNLISAKDDAVKKHSVKSSSSSVDVERFIRQIPWLETGSNLSEAYKSLRAEAEELAKARFSYFNRATNAFRSNRKAEAKRLAAEGRKLEARMREANAKAAAEMYAHRNQKLATNGSINAIDVHGLLPEEALEAIENYLTKLQEDGTSQEWMCIITGTGHHSRTGKAVLRDEIAAYLDDIQVPFFETSKDGRGGMFMVQLQ